MIDAHDPKKLYSVWIYDECDMLTNVLRAYVMLKGKQPHNWPSSITIREGNRLDFGLGDHIKINTANWLLIDAIYFSLYAMEEDVPTRRNPTIIKAARVPIQDEKGSIYKFRFKKDEVIDDPE